MEFTRVVFKTCGASQRGEMGDYRQMGTLPRVFSEHYPRKGEAAHCTRVSKTTAEQMTSSDCAQSGRIMLRSLRPDLQFEDMCESREGADWSVNPAVE